MMGGMGRTYDGSYGPVRDRPRRAGHPVRHQPAVGRRRRAAGDEIGATVISTTWHADRAEELRAVGADHPVVDDGHLAEKILALVPQGVDAALELVGCSVLADTLRTVRRQGTVCFTGALAGQWSLQDFTPFMIPVGVRLTSYADEAADLPSDVFARQLQAIAEGRLKVPVAKVYRGLEQARDAQAETVRKCPPGRNRPSPRPWG